jgi:hypothetical protein
MSNLLHKGNRDMSLKELRELRQEWSNEVSITIRYHTPEKDYILLQRFFDDNENNAVINTTDKLKTIEDNILSKITPTPKDKYYMSICLMNKNDDIIGTKKIDTSLKNMLGLSKDDAVEYIKIIRQRTIGDNV